MLGQNAVEVDRQPLFRRRRGIGSRCQRLFSIVVPGCAYAAPSNCFSGTCTLGGRVSEPALWASPGASRNSEQRAVRIGERSIQIATWAMSRPVKRLGRSISARRAGLAVVIANNHAGGPSHPEPLIVRLHLLVAEQVNRIEVA